MTNVAAAPLFASDGASRRLATTRHEPRLTAAAVMLAVLMLPTILALALDDRTHLGINVWIKPLKFQVALIVYLATLIWFARYVPQSVLGARWYPWFAHAVVAAMAAEIIWIVAAAATGVGSHFNVSTSLMAALYPLMGALAALLTSMTTVYGVAILRDAHSRLSPALQSGLGLGLLLTLPLTLVTAGAMSLFPGHEIGGDGLDRGAAVLMGWSRDGGDLRVAHFFATHAMHVLPVVGLVASAFVSATRGKRIVFAAATAYVALVAYTFLQALAGQPFLPGLL